MVRQLTYFISLRLWNINAAILISIVINLVGACNTSDVYDPSHLSSLSLATKHSPHSLNILAEAAQRKASYVAAMIPTTILQAHNNYNQ